MRPIIQWVLVICRRRVRASKKGTPSGDPATLRYQTPPGYRANRSARFRILSENIEDGMDRKLEGDLVPVVASDPNVK